MNEIQKNDSSDASDIQ